MCNNLNMCTFPILQRRKWGLLKLPLAQDCTHGQRVSLEDTEEISGWGLDGHRVRQALLALSVGTTFLPRNSRRCWPSTVIFTASVACMHKQVVKQPGWWLSLGPVLLVSAGRLGRLAELWKDIVSDKHVACQSLDGSAKHRLWTLVPEASQMTELGFLRCRQHLRVVILV